MLGRVEGIRPRGHKIAGHDVIGLRVFDPGGVLVLSGTAVMLECSGRARNGRETNLHLIPVYMHAQLPVDHLILYKVPSNVLYKRRRIMVNFYDLGCIVNKHCYLIVEVVAELQHKLRTAHVDMTVEITCRELDGWSLYS